MSHFLFRVRFSHVRVFSDSRNVQKRATKSETSGHCLSMTDTNRYKQILTYMDQSWIALGTKVKYLQIQKCEQMAREAYERI